MKCDGIVVSRNDVEQNYYVERSTVLIKFSWVP